MKLNGVKQFSWTGPGHQTFCILPNQPSLSESDSILHFATDGSPNLRSTGVFSNNQAIEAASSDTLMRYIHENTIGVNQTFRGPFGKRRGDLMFGSLILFSVVYCDWTASGRSLAFIEEYINTEVLPIYGNTHTTTSVNSLQTTMFRSEARNIIRNAVHASKDDAVIFVGSGCTGAIHKLIHNLNLEQPPVSWLFCFVLIVIDCDSRAV